MTDAPILELEGVAKTYGGRRWPWQPRPAPAVEGIDLRLARGGALGLVGESGSGKTTVARIAAGLLPPSAGAVRLDGRDISALSRRAVGRRVQMVFQEAGGSLNPRRTVRRALGAPLRALLGLSGETLTARLDALCARVQLDPGLLDRYPHELSGGEAQRAAIARALAPEPDLLVLDEPTSALDVSVQARVVGMLRDLRAELDLAYLFVSHDLAVVEALCDEVAVLHEGRIVEAGPTRTVLYAPADPYTRMLIASVPVPGERRLLAHADG